jgi:hypothetical protein
MAYAEPNLCKEKDLQVADWQVFQVFGGASGIRTPDLRIMIPSL